MLRLSKGMGFGIKRNLIRIKSFLLSFLSIFKLSQHMLGIILRVKLSQSFYQTSVHAAHHTSMLFAKMYSAAFVFFLNYFYICLTCRFFKHLFRNKMKFNIWEIVNLAYEIKSLNTCWASYFL